MLAHVYLNILWKHFEKWTIIDGMFLQAHFKVFIKRIDVRNDIISKHFHFSILFHKLISQSCRDEVTVIGDSDV